MTRKNQLDRHLYSSGVRALASAVIIEAARDAAKGDQEAADWLRDPETADIWGAVAGVRWSAVITWLDDGCKMQRTTMNRARAAHTKAAFYG